MYKGLLWCTLASCVVVVVVVVCVSVFVVLLESSEQATHRGCVINPKSHEE